MLIFNKRMKNIFSTLLFLLFFSVIGFSQKIGINVSLNNTLAERNTNILGNTAIDPSVEIETSSELGMRTGLVLEYEYDAGFTIGAQGLYSRKSYSYNGKTDEVFKETINYLDIPVYLGYNLTINKKAKVIYNYFVIKAFVVAGLGFGIAMNGQNASELTTTEIQFGDAIAEPGTKDLTYKTLNNQFIVSGGLSIGSLRFTVGYDLGISDLDNTENGILKLDALNFGIGWVYDFKAKHY